MSILPPPPAPPVITLDDDDNDNDGGKKEDGELSDDDKNSKSSNDNNKDAPADAAAGAKPRKKRSKKKKAKKAAGSGTTAADIIPDTPAEGSDIEVVGGNFFEIDDDGADINDVGLDMTMDDINNEEVFKKIQRATGINGDYINISINIPETVKATRKEGTCFNCRGPHTLNECTLPKDKGTITRNRQSFGSTRKDRITERTESKFAAGKLTKETLTALNLYEHEYPQWIYGMRNMGPFQGYPPAYLKRLKPCDKRLSFYCNDPHLTTEVAKAELEFDPEKIIYYDGFNLIDPNSPAEQRCNQYVRKELRYKVWTKTNYPGEFERFLKDSINKDRVAESRKRQHNDNDYYQQQQYNQGKRGRYDNDANSVGPSSSTSRGNQNRPNTHIIFKDTDTPASPELPPVVSRLMTEDQAAPKLFLVAEVDDRKMPNTGNFSKDITPFQYDNLQERRGTLDTLEKLIQSVKKD